MIDQITKNFTNEISKMSLDICVSLENDTIKSLLSTFENATNKLRENNNKGLINPNKKEGARIGFFPTAGDPLHWAHLLTAYQILAEYELDKIVFIIGGEDTRKPDLTKFSVRKSMADHALKIFGNFFEFSDISAINENFKNDGETNMFLDISRRNDKKIQAFYMVGSDHFNWISAKGGDDTIKKLYDNIDTFKIPISGAIFIARNPEEITPIKIEEMKTKINSRYNLNIFVPALSFSSTQLRDAFSKNPIAMIPHITYQDIRNNDLYGSKCDKNVKKVHVTLSY
jgi:nicotinic acid mononucleotide adenylyltransferase